jgi:methylation protein EvaC
MRYTLANQGCHTVKNTVFELLEKEKNLGLDRQENLLKFKEKVEQSRNDLVNLLKKLKMDGKRVAGYGATSKSTTILNYCGIGPDLIEYICDTTPTKQEKLTPGMHIPVRHYSYFQQNPPDYTFLFAWNHLEEIMAKEHGFTQSGGKWITHVPKVQIL